VNQHILLYDSECPLCVFQMRLLTWLDWTNSLAVIPITDPRAQAAAPGVSRGDLSEAMHVVTRSGKIHRGARCIRFVGMRLPLLVPVALFLWFPGVIWIAEHVYRWISANRLILSRLFGCKDACAILPKREREQDKLA
jgi:predicted DCC family thiol-disulfide oxidoreductase YuxK